MHVFLVRVLRLKKVFCRRPKRFFSNLNISHEFKNPSIHVDGDNRRSHSKIKQRNKLRQTRFIREMFINITNWDWRFQSFQLLHKTLCEATFKTYLLIIFSVRSKVGFSSKEWRERLVVDYVFISAKLTQAFQV